jgi:mannose-1-phosphate guanylyltransferase
MNIARLQFTPKADLPTYGNYISWGGSGLFMYTTEFYLANMKKDDPVIMNKLIDEFGLQNPNIQFSIRHIVDDYSLLAIHY